RRCASKWSIARSRLLQTTIYCGIAPGIEVHSGGYFKDCTVSEQQPAWSAHYCCRRLHARRQRAAARQTPRCCLSRARRLSGGAFSNSWGLLTLPTGVARSLSDDTAHGSHSTRPHVADHNIV